MYFLGEELFGTEVGLLAAFLLGACFWHIDLSRVGFRAIMAPLCLVWTLYFLIKSFRSSKELRAWIYAIVGGIIFAAGFYTYIAYRVTPLLLLLFIPFFKKYPGFWKRTAVFVIVAFLVALPIGLYFLHNPGDFFGRTAEISVTTAKNPLGEFVLNVGKTLAMFNFKGDGNWRQNIAGAPELFLPVGILFLLGIVLAIISLWRSAERRENEDGNDTITVRSISRIHHFPYVRLVCSCHYSRSGIGRRHPPCPTFHPDASTGNLSCRARWRLDISQRPRQWF